MTLQMKMKFLFIIQHVGVKYLAKHRRLKGGLCTIMKLI